MELCEDYPCCGHSAPGGDNPCARQPYDEPGYFDNPLNRLASTEPGSPEYYDELENLYDDSY